jgi:putative tryptophan/tyrosine transport system substrate-binding protein
MRRREFAKLVAATALWPTVANAQKPMPVIGFLSSRAPSESALHVAAFLKGLSEAGYVVAQNVVIEYRWAEGQYDRLPTLAVALVEHKVDVIASFGGSPAALAAKTASSTIPIVFHVGGDPVDEGLIASLARPGGNLTGVSFPVVSRERHSCFASIR